MGDWHIGRAFVGHEIEDDCPCPKAACGLVPMAEASPHCTQHRMDKTMRQSHAADACPAAPVAATDTGDAEREGWLRRLADDGPSCADTPAGGSQRAAAAWALVELARLRAEVARLHDCMLRQTKLNTGVINDAMVAEAEVARLRAENERLQESADMHARDARAAIASGADLLSRLDAVRRLCDESREPDDVLTTFDSQAGWRLGWGQMQDAVRAVLSDGTLGEGRPE